MINQKNQDIIKILRKFVSKYGSLYKGKFNIDDKMNSAFDNIANNSKVLFCTDIEFHNQVLNNNKYIVNNNNSDSKINIVPFIREIGIIIFVKDSNKWSYIGHIFKNVENIYDENTIFILSKYATVSDITYKVMEKGDKYYNIYEIIANLTIDNLDNKVFNIINSKLSVKYINKIFEDKDYNNIKLGLKILKRITLSKKTTNEKKITKLNKDLKYAKRLLSITRNMPFRVYPKILDKEGKDIYYTQMDSYYNDKLVKNRTFTIKDLKNFFTLWLSFDNEVCYIVKGKNDFIAIKNTMLDVLNHCDIKFSKVYDIEMFNWFSYIKFGSAQLENTFIGMQNYFKEYDNLNMILSNFPYKNAHNPVVDSYYTIIVALYINLILNASLIK
ncbi:hypothetical protein Hokovirus_3_61 [Hokovirus HKV1]|uniref:Uncharacterized protein n=1 Tax=Hokovirus HKV1 TaxID=1977638 RepID=A0A1V0SGN1_9VIRU|nr:hypothetical protein Hokovirus_3_61 [Hokovirus HKV1]